MTMLGIGSTVFASSNVDIFFGVLPDTIGFVVRLVKGTGVEVGFDTKFFSESGEGVGC